MVDAGLEPSMPRCSPLEYMRRRELPVRGLSLTAGPEALMEEDNRRMIEELGGVPVIACLEAGAEELCFCGRLRRCMAPGTGKRCIRQNAAMAGEGSKAYLAPPAPK